MLQRANDEPLNGGDTVSFAGAVNKQGTKKRIKSKKKKKNGGMSLQSDHRCSCPGEQFKNLILTRSKPRRMHAPPLLPPPPRSYYSNALRQLASFRRYELIYPCSRSPREPSQVYHAGFNSFKETTQCPLRSASRFSYRCIAPLLALFPSGPCL